MTTIFRAVGMDLAEGVYLRETWNASINEFRRNEGV